MKYFNRELVIVSVLSTAFIAFVIMFAIFLPKHEERVYNCSIAEISPDYPVQVKEGCRKLRMEQK